MSIAKPIMFSLVLAAALMLNPLSIANEAWGQLSPITAERVALLRAQIRSNFLIPATLPVLDAQIHRQFEPAPGVAATAVSYATTGGMRVPAIMYAPVQRASERRPALVIVNGHGGDKYSWYSYYAGILFVRAGAVVLTYDQPGEGERTVSRQSGTRNHDKITGGEELARRLCGLMMADAMQAVSYLASRPDVDSRRIAAIGHSMGSFVVSLVGAVDPQLRVCVMTGGGNLDGPGGYWDTNNKPMCQSLPYRSLVFLGDRAATIYALQAARGPSLIWNGRLDVMLAGPGMQGPYFQDLRKRVVRLRGSEENVFEVGFTDGVGHRPHFLERPVALWLQDKMDFPNWSETAIRQMAVCRIGDWAKKNGVAMDPLYATEERAAGVRALDCEAPGFTRSDLSVFSDEEWARVWRDYALETWVERAARECTIGGKTW